MFTIPENKLQEIKKYRKEAMKATTDIEEIEYLNKIIEIKNYYTNKGFKEVMQHIADNKEIDIISRKVGTTTTYRIYLLINETEIYIDTIDKYKGKYNSSYATGYISIKEYKQAVIKNIEIIVRDLWENKLFKLETI